MFLRQQLRARLAKAHRTARAAALLHLAHDEKADAEDEDERQRLIEKNHPETGAFFGFAAKADPGFAQTLGQLWIGNRVGAELLAAVSRAGNDVARFDDFLDRAVFDFFEEFRIGDALRLRIARAAVDHRNHHRQGEQNACPDHQAADPRVRLRCRIVVHRGHSYGSSVKIG